MKMIEVTALILLFVRPLRALYVLYPINCKTGRNITHITETKTATSGTFPHLSVVPQPHHHAEATKLGFFSF